MTALTSVLIVDDEPTVRDTMAEWVVSLGLNPKIATNVDEAVAALRTERCDLAVIDIMMPGRDGLWLADKLRREHPQTAVVFATRYTSLVDLDRPAPPFADLLIKPFARERFALALDRGRQWRQEAIEEERWLAQLAAELRERTENISAEIRRRTANGAREADVLLEMSNARMPAMMAHAERVARFAVSVARDLALNHADLALIEDAARFHDIGLLAMPEPLLTKPSPLASGEEALVRRHVEAGAELLSSCRALNHLAHIVFATHEWYGGGGYPLKLQARAIPICSRIIAVAESYDAMTHDRHYRERLDSAEAVSELLRCRATQFDPQVVTAFLGVLGRH